MSYYRSILMANQDIDRQIETAKNNGSPLNIPLLILNITSRFEVNEKLVYKRIKLYCDSDKSIKNYGDELVFE